MTSYNTGNPLGSKDPRDLYDNAENLDTAVNDVANDTWKDRFGRSRKTMSGMERQFDADQADRDARFNNFIASSGYQFLGDYAAGIEITEYNQIVRDSSGEFWRVSGQVDLPYTTTGAGLPEGVNFVAVGDAALRQELIEPLNQISDLFSQGGLKSKGGLSFPVEKRRPVAALIDDDAHEKVMTVLKPFYDSLGVKGGIAVPTALIGQPGRLTWEQVKQLYDEGWEILSHTKNNKNLNGLSEEEISYELREARADIESHGMTVESFVPVQGASGGEAGIRQTQNHYRASFVTLGSVQPDNFRNYRVVRFNAIRSSVETNPTFADFKNYIDQSVAENKAMVFTTHIFYAGATTEQLQVFADAINYAKSLGVEFVTPSKLLDIHGNKLEFGRSDYFGGLISPYPFAITAEGSIWPAGARYELATSRTGELRNGLSPITSFAENQTTVMRINTRDGMPFVGQGIGLLETRHLFMNNAERYGCQWYHPYDLDSCFFRNWMGSQGEWSDWQRVPSNVEPNLVFYNDSALDGNSPITDYPRNKKLITRTYAGAEGWPGGAGSGRVFVVETYRYSVDGNTYGKQVAWNRATGTEYKRYWLHNATDWTDWEQIP